jgi:5-methylcytosine-specific restriction protein A
MSEIRDQIPSTNDYVSAFRILEGLTEKHVEMLRAHYNSPDRTVTAPELAELVGYSNLSAVNSQYGRLARKVGELVAFQPEPEQLGSIVEFEFRNDSWHWILRPEVAEALERLGWIVEDQTIQNDSLTVGQIYKRTALHDYFGGQRQNGISTPSNSDTILIFSGSSGESFGYQDGWLDDDRTVFQYTGEGQEGDMVFTKGNSAIRDHLENDKRLLLFFSQYSGHVKYIGEMRCIDHGYFKTLDGNNTARNGIRFTLERISKDPLPKTSQPEIHSKRPYKKPTTTERQGLVTSRVGQGYYRQNLLDKFGHRCAVVGAKLPEILIASHIVPWKQSNEDERLDVENGILLSPNYDALFDKHLISFDDEGLIIISSLLDAEMIQNLGIDTNAKIQVTEGMMPYLSRHRETLR